MIFSDNGELNPRPLDDKSNVLTVTVPSHLNTDMMAKPRA